MFIVNLTYIKPLDEVEKHLEKTHRFFLNQYYTKGLFIASGRKKSKNWRYHSHESKKNKDAVQEIIAHDPFYQNEIAQYEIIEFEASKYCLELKTLLSDPLDENEEIK